MTNGVPIAKLRGKPTPLTSVLGHVKHYAEKLQVG